MWIAYDVAESLLHNAIINALVYPVIALGDCSASTVAI